MKVFQTGIRSGEFITSSQGAKQNQGSLFQVRGDYPPSRSALPTDDYEWAIFSQQLESIPFFAKLSFPERKAWLITHSTPDDDLYLQEVPLKVKIIRLSGSFFREKLDDETITRLTKGNPEDPEGYWDLSYIYQLIPKKPGSRAARHTLIFRPSNWTLHNSPWEDQSKLQSFSGLVIDLEIPAFGYVSNEPVDYLVPIGEGQVLGMRTKSSSDPVSLPEQTKPIVEFLSWATPSVHKSLIQKIIRTGAATVEEWSGDLVLIVSFVMLLNHPGAFVPDIQRFVTGQESALKRLAVSICEDSYTPYPGELMSLYAAALLTQVQPRWKPTLTQVNRWIQLATQARADRRYYLYSTKTQAPVPSSPTTVYQVNHLLLATLKSFETDLNMLGTMDGSYAEGQTLLKSMPFIHALDQHNITDIVYYFPKDLNLPYHELVKLIWERSSGVNPRKGMSLDESDPVIQMIRGAQRLIYLAKTTQPVERTLIQGQTTFEYTLDDSWLSGMVGPITVGEYLVSLHPQDIYTYVVIKRPSRGDKDLTQLSPEVQEQAQIRVKQILSGGVPLKIISSALPWFSGGILYLQNDQYVIQLGDTLIPWDQAKRMTRSFPHHSPLPLSLENSIKWVGPGIEVQSEESLRKLIEALSESVRQRILVHLSSGRSVISMFKVSRDGTGQEFTVKPEDTGAFHFFSALCVLYPGALRKLNTREFKVTYGPLIWRIQEQLSREVRKTKFTGVEEWGSIYDRLNRKLWPHQQSGWQRLLSGRGHLLWFPVGLGKTLIILRYIQELIQTQSMPQYLVYTLPPSAIENTIREVTAFGLKVHLMDFRKQSSLDEKTLKPFTVNLVKHDHIRLSQGLFHEKITETLFIVDEFHLTLNKTIRTSLALELAKTSHDFIGLTGTITQSENVDDLIEWLQQIVPFEVTVDNFWSAASMMVSGLIQTGVRVNRHELEVEMNPEVKERYLKLVGASLGGNNPNPSVKDFRDAVDLCQQVCLLSMTNAVISYYNQGETLFVVTKDIAQQNELKNLLLSVGLPEREIILLDKDTSVALSSDSQSPIRVIVTTIRHSTGYTCTKSRIMLTSVYFSNQATREQLEGRINRIGQKSPEVWLMTFHTGILTHILKRYDQARTLSQALKQLAPEVQL